MSLVSTYVRAKDGLLYRNPTLSGKDWFICFDDDDPVELVVKTEGRIKDPGTFLKSIGIRPTDLRKASTGSQRCFSKDHAFHPAKSWFFEINDRIDHNLITEHDGTFESMSQIGQGVFYDFNECEKCGKSIAARYSLCYRHHKEEEKKNGQIPVIK